MTKQNLLTLYNLSKNVNGLENVLNFISEVYELAYGDDAINKDYSSEEVLETLRGYSDRALYTEQLMEEENFHKENYQEFLKRGYL